MQMSNIIDLYKRAEYSKCEKACIKVIGQDKNNFEARELLCQALIAQRKYKPANSQLVKALKLSNLSNSQRATFLTLKARVASREAKDSDALNYYRKALKADPSRMDIQCAIAVEYYKKNNFEKSKQFIFKILSAESENESVHFAQALYLFSRLAAPSEAVEFLADHAGLRRLKTKQPSYFFGMGRLLDLVKDYQSALQAFQIGNSLQRSISKYDIRADLDLMDSYQNSFDSDMWEQNPLPQQARSPVPIFIVGMPRTGSSLFEQLLGSHSDVLPCGEVSWLTDSLERAIKGRGDLSFTEMASLVTDRQFITDIRKYYFAAMPSLSSRFVTDKMPGNGLYLWLIRFAFPEAFVFHTKRAQQAMIWSCYRTYFETGHHYSESLVELRRYADKYEELLAGWGREMNENYRLVPYEELVKSTQLVMTRVLDTLSLPLEEVCFTTKGSSRVVNTASRTQVTEAVYDNANKNWLNYAKFLDTQIG